MTQTARMQWRVAWLQLTPVSEDEASGFYWASVREGYPGEQEAREAAATMRRLASDMPGMFRSVRLEVREVTDWIEVPA